MGDETGQERTERHRPWRDAAAVAARQGRHVALDQLRGVGLSDEQIRRARQTGRLVRVHRGVDAMPPLDPTPLARAWAAHLAVGPDSFVMREAALALHGLRPWAKGPIHVGAAVRRRAPAGAVVHVARDLRRGDVFRVGGLPATSPTRTLLDVAAVLGPDPLAVLLCEALATRRTSRTKLDDLLARTVGHRGLGALAAAVAAERHDPGEGRTHHEMEAMFLPMLRALPDLPPYRRNVPLDFGDGVVVPDVWFPGPRVWLELDSRRWHEQRRTMDADRRKDQRAVARGIAPFRITWRHLLHEWLVVSADLLSTLHLRRGW